MQYLKEDVKAKILSSALIEFEANGYLEASMRGIASSAGIALGSTYRYFKNKEALFNVIIDPVYDKLLSYLNNIQNELNTKETYNDCKTFELILDILNKIMEFVKEWRKELLIIFNKSKGSKYENFKNELTTLVNNIFIRVTNKDIEEDRIVIYTVAHDLVEGLAFILSQGYEGEKVKILVHKLLNFYITDIEKRF